jgi:glycosyltransferase involved in cell wall biosynthesis
MRIAQVATCSTPVRPDHAGSVELLVWLLSRELVRMGHEVTVFGCAGADVECGFVATLPGTYGEAGSPDDWMACEWINLAGAVARAGAFDVVHSHVYTWGIPLAGAARVPMVHTLHIQPYDDDARTWRLHPASTVTALSRVQWAEFPDLTPAAVVPHGVDPAAFTLRVEPEDDLVYLGRFIENKGPLEAIAAARACGRRLLLAGPASPYFEQHVRPLVDGERVVYVGPVDTAGRDALLGGAAALIYPLREPEPFGLVQVEAMMCGTPVVATAIGAVPEIVTAGVTGEVVGSVDELPGAVERAVRLDRRRVRAEAETRFGVRRMAADYLRVYGQVAR